MKNRRSSRKRRSPSNIDQESFFREEPKTGFFDSKIPQNDFFSTNTTPSPPEKQREDLPDDLHHKLEWSFGQDFSSVQIHQNSPKATDLQAKAFTQGEQVHFAPGQFDPKSNSGQKLIAHEFTHIAQQRHHHIPVTHQTSTGAFINNQNTWEQEADRLGERAIQGQSIDQYTSTDHTPTPSHPSTAVVQRTALASWEEANDQDRLSALSAKDQAKYAKQQQKIAAGKKVKNPIALPTVEKILKVKANYHYYSQYPSNDPSQPFQIGSPVINEVKRQFRMNTSPNFFPHIDWVDKDGNARKIGLRFDLSFMPHKAATTTNDPDYSLNDNPISDIPAVKQNPWDNVFLMQHIDRITDYDEISLENWLQTNKITTIVFTNNYTEVIYTPDGGGSPQTFKIPDQMLEVKRLARQEYLRIGGDPQKLQEDASGSEVLGRGNRTGITVDPIKTAPDQPFSFPKYERMDGQEENYLKYRGQVESKFSEITTMTYPPAERNKRIAAVIAHEIGHNIGMVHTDLGIMSESAEENVKARYQTAIYKNPDAVVGGEVFAWEIKYESGSDMVQPQNVQALADRIRTFTEEMPQERYDDLGILPDKVGLWSQQRDQFFALLNANDFAAIFASTMMLSMLYLPYEEELLDQLKDQQTITADDRTAIRTMANNRAAASVSDWNNLSQGAKDYIVRETKRLLNKVGSSGMTYFESVDALNAF
ncbi:MAG: DUF4157 domain-containing protein [Bacteroidota bacterium]